MFLFVSLIIGGEETEGIDIGGEVAAPGLSPAPTPTVSCPG